MVWLRQAGYPLPHQDPGRDRPLRPERVQSLPSRCGFQTASAGSGGLFFPSETAGAFSRKQLDELQELAKQLGAGGLPYAKWGKEGLASSFKKFLNEEQEAQLKAALEVAGNGLAIFAVGTDDQTSRVLGRSPGAPRQAVRPSGRIPLRVPLGRGLPPSSSGTTRPSASWPAITPSPAPTPMTWTFWSPIPGPGRAVAYDLGAQWL